MSPTWGAERGVSRSDEGRREPEDFCADAAAPSEVRFSGGLRGDGRLAELWSSEALGTCRDSRSSIFNYCQVRVLPTLHGSSRDPERGPMHPSSPGGGTEHHRALSIKSPGNPISLIHKNASNHRFLEDSAGVISHVTVSTAIASALRTPRRPN